MSGVEAMIREAERSLGLGEPNHIQSWYAGRNGAAYSYNFPWCDAAITYWAVKSGEHAAVCFGTDYALTTAHASRFQKAGRWRSGTGGIKRGDIVFFDWGGSRSISRIDHVGIVTSVKGSKIYTIEGNTSNRCLRRVRGAGVIAGYGRPAYGSGGGAHDGEDEDMLGLKKGDKGPRVSHLQYMIRLAGYGDLLGTYGSYGDGVDGDYGKATARALLKLRTDWGSSATDGDEVTHYAAGQVKAMVARAQAR